MKFSERQGLAPAPTTLQTSGMSPELRASLWNMLHVRIWDSAGFMHAGGYSGEIVDFAKAFWFIYFKRPFSEIPYDPESILHTIQEHFFSVPWHGVYDFIEALLQIRHSQELIDGLNFVLTRELAGFRLVERKFVPVTATEEVAALQEALGDDRFAGVTAHLRSALALLSDRKTPDYRNSIKESISAVEAIAQRLSGNNKATLDDALKILERNGKLHPALKRGFSALYGYTSDADGIRHAMLDEPNLTVADAKFFLLSCTSFTNYLKSQI
jgi:hypothetical protein